MYFFLIYFLVFIHFIQRFLIHAVNEKVITASIKQSQTILCSYAPQNAFANNAYSIAEDICFLHGMGSEYHGPIICFLAFLKDVPKLSSCLWVQACCWFIQEDDFGFRYHTNCNGQSSTESKRKVSRHMIFHICQIDFLQSLLY